MVRKKGQLHTERASVPHKDLKGPTENMVASVKLPSGGFRTMESSTGAGIAEFARGHCNVRTTETSYTVQQGA